MPFCSKCGKEVAQGIDYCPSCGTPLHPATVVSMKQPEHVSSAWYLVPFFLGIIGGLIAWVVNKDRDAKKARNFLVFGLIWTVVLFVVITVFGYALYAISA